MILRWQYRILFIHRLFISITPCLDVVRMHFKMDHLFRVPGYVTEATVQNTFHTLTFYLYDTLLGCCDNAFQNGSFV